MVVSTLRDGCRVEGVPHVLLRRGGARDRRGRHPGLAGGPDPARGSVGESVAHAQSVLDLQATLSLHVESWLIGAVSGSTWATALEWLYTNIHLPVLFGFVAAARLLAPTQLPVASHDVRPLVRARGPRDRPLSAGSAPLAAGVRARRAALGRRADGHGAVPQLDGGGGEPALRLRGLRRRGVDLALSSLPARWADPCLPGARLRRHRRHRQPLRARLRRRHPDVRSRRGRRVAPARAIGGHDVRLRARAGRRASRSATRSIAWGFVSLDLTALGAWETNVPFALVLAAGVACVVAPRLAAKEPLPESR